MTRDEHLKWAKGRALEYLPGDVANAYTSFMSDTQKTCVHFDGKEAPCIDWHQPLGLHVLGTLGMQAAVSRNADKMRRWIEGFN